MLFWDISEKRVKQYKKILEQIKLKEKDFENMSLEDVKAKTKEFQDKFKDLDFTQEEDAVKVRKILEEIKVEAFALVKQASKLIYWQKFEITYAWGKTVEYEWKMIPYDVQLIWGLALHDGNISEMKTWEWKTLVATLPLYLNALTWNSSFLVTVNDYLADRDAKEMWILYDALGLTTWIITPNRPNSEKQEQYSKDIVYATNNELGFDYLRDNMATKKKNKVQPKLFFAVVDEVDSILIDEARTPLIISAPDNEPTTKYTKFAAMAKELKEGEHYKIEEKQKTAVLTEHWIEKIEKMIGVENIYVSAHYNDLHHIENALKAKAVYLKDKDYIVTNDEVMIVDEMTWRVLSGRRYSEGLHQAIEAKENVEIRQESRTLASITFQNYFRMFFKLAWMTWTAKTEEEEFYKVYNLDVIVVPTNKPVIREDKSDLLFKSEEGKYDYLVEYIKQLNESGRPILVGTVSVAKSEYLSNKLKQAGLSHSVLNAKHHDKEAEIISNAWEKGAITIATNMAWRGTDIKLSPEVIELGGLIIIWTEKHESRRIDNQLRGRSGRQGDPWMTQFLISPTDDIMRIFWGDKLFSVFNSPMFASIPANEPLAESGMLTRRITSVQKQVEGHHFDIRKHVLEYDDVMNQHRDIIYTRRDKILDSENIDGDVIDMIKSQVEKAVMAEASEIVHTDTLWEIREKLNDFLNSEFITESDLEEDKAKNIEDIEDLKDYVINKALEKFDEIKSKFEDEEQVFELERRLVLQSIDELWMMHIDNMSRLRQDVAFAGYAQKNPLIVYKWKAYDKFVELLDEVEFKVTKALFMATPKTEIEVINMPEWVELTEEQAEELVKQAQKIQENMQNNNAIPKNSNPLFVNPNTAPKNNDKKKYRV